MDRESNAPNYQTTTRHQIRSLDEIEAEKAEMRAEVVAEFDRELVFLKQDYQTIHNEISLQNQLESEINEEIESLNEFLKHENDEMARVQNQISER